VRYGGFTFGNLHQADGHRMARAALASTADGPTAIFAVNSSIAFVAIRGLHKAGIRGPGDMSVVAFDDLPAEWVSEPFLTVVAQPACEIGRHAAAMLAERIAGERVTADEDMVPPFELVIRRATARHALTRGSPGRGNGPMNHPSTARL
jgi:DNA-binding LacI/PurR family transcriptional regulator